MRFEADTIVAAERERLFEFLGDLSNHWHLAGPEIEVVRLTGPVGARSGGVVRLRGPLGLRRTVATDVAFASPPAEMRGTARIGPRTQASVRWRLDEVGSGVTRVSLAATVERAGPADRLLLAFGGARWMRRLLARTLARLEPAQTASSTAPSSATTSPSSLTTARSS